LSRNEIGSIPMLPGLTNLRELWLNYNHITDMSTVSTLTNLTQLHLFGNQIHDISAVSGLTNLTSLGLGDNQITDISSVSRLTKLVKLYLNNNRVSDTSALSGLTSLKYLSLQNNPLNTAAYCIYLPLVRSSNLNLTSLTYDPNPNPLTENDIANLIDFVEFALNWLETGCGEHNNWCDGADLNHSGNVDLNDVAEFAEYLLEDTDE